MRTLAWSLLMAGAAACSTVREEPDAGSWSWVAERDDNGYLDVRRGDVYATRAEAQDAVDRFLRSNPEFTGRGRVIPAPPEGAPRESATERSGLPAVGRAAPAFLRLQSPADLARPPCAVARC